MWSRGPGVWGGGLESVAVGFVWCGVVGVVWGGVFGVSPPAGLGSLSGRGGVGLRGRVALRWVWPGSG